MTMYLSLESRLRACEKMSVGAVGKTLVICSVGYRLISPSTGDEMPLVCSSA